MKKKDVIKIIQKICHSLGKPDFNGENHIIDVDGMHWKELSEKFELEIKNLTKHNNDFKKVCQECNEVLTDKEKECSDLDGLCYACYSKYLDKPISKS